MSNVRDVVNRILFSDEMYLFFRSSIGELYIKEIDSQQHEVVNYRKIINNNPTLSSSISIGFLTYMDKIAFYSSFFWLFSGYP